MNIQPKSPSLNDEPTFLVALHPVNPVHSFKFLSFDRPIRVQSDQSGQLACFPVPRRFAVIRGNLRQNVQKQIPVAKPGGSGPREAYSNPNPTQSHLRVRYFSIWREIYVSK